MLADLAVSTEGVSRILHAYGFIDFVPLSDDDPIIKGYGANSLELRRAYGYAYIDTFKVMRGICILQGCSGVMSRSLQWIGSRKVYMICARACRSLGLKVFILEMQALRFIDNSFIEFGCALYTMRLHSAFICLKESLNHSNHPNRPLLERNLILKLCSTGDWCIDPQSSCRADDGFNGFGRSGPEFVLCAP